MAVEIVEAETLGSSNQIENVSIKDNKEAATGEITREEATAIKERKSPTSSKSSRAEISLKPDAEAEVAV